MQKEKEIGVCDQHEPTLATQASNVPIEPLKSSL